MKVQKIIDKDPDIYERSGAAKLGISSSYFNKINLKKLGIKSFKKRLAPGASEEQKRRTRKSCWKLYKRICAKKMIVLMDDETYIPKDPKLAPGTQWIHVKKKEDIPIKKRLKTRES